MTTPTPNPTPTPGTFRSLRSNAVGQSMRTLLEHRLITAEGEYRGALEQYRGAMRLHRRITYLQDEGRLEESEGLKVRLMEVLHRGVGEEGREGLRELERSVIEGDGVGRGLGGGDVGVVEDVSFSEGSRGGSEDASSGGKGAGVVGGRKGRGKSFRKAVFVSVCAWVLALVGLCVSVTFLTKGFVDSKRNPVVTRSFEEENELALPVISICSTNVDVSAFADFPNDRFKGHPLFTISEVYYLENDTKVEFKDGSVDRFEIGVLGPGEKECEDKLSTIDADVANQVTGQVVLPSENEEKCAACFTIGQREPIMVSSERAGKGLPSGISVNVVMSRMYSYCFIESVRNFNVLQNIFEAELMREIKPLVDKKILSFGNVSVDLDDKDDVLRKLVFQTENRENNQGLEAVEFYCNVYFFSGHFYPLPEGKKADIKYLYNGTTWPQVWIKDPESEGPYFKVVAQATLDEILSQESLGLKPVKETDTFSLLNSVSLAIYASAYEEGNRQKKDKLVDTRTLVAQIDRSRGALIRFRQQGSIDSKSSVRVASISTTDDRPPPSVEGPFLANRLNFTYDRFLVEKLDKQETYGKWQFIADILEVLTLFTGLSFYSVIVVPATAFLVQRQRRRRRQAIQQAIAQTAADNVRGSSASSSE